MPVRARDNFITSRYYIGMEVNLDTYPRPVDFPIGQNRLSARYNYDIVNLNPAAITFQTTVNYNIIIPTYGIIRYKYELFRPAQSKY